jgi:hypothetical protein
MFGIQALLVRECHMKILRRATASMLDAPFAVCTEAGR